MYKFSNLYQNAMYEAWYHYPCIHKTIGHIIIYVKAITTSNIIGSCTDSQIIIIMLISCIITLVYLTKKDVFYYVSILIDVDRCLNGLYICQYMY